jgi:hypothetical protein
MRRQALQIISALASISFVAGCGTSDETETVEMGDDSKSDAVKAIRVSDGKVANVVVKGYGGDRAVTIDCGVPSDPDATSVAFSVTAPTLDVGNKPTDDRSGYYRWSGSMPSGNHTITITGTGGAGTCHVSTSRLSGQCNDNESWHSPNANHTHFRVGTDTSRDWESFPASGNHWGAWAAWGTEYQRPIKRGFLLHNLEHGGIVLSYNCESPIASDACKQKRDDLAALFQSFGQKRVILTPDPTQPTAYAVRAWRWAFTSDCFNATTMRKFMSTHIHHGREDVDADPPMPFDPTTTKVPCQDLMAAPDSCN